MANMRDAEFAYSIVCTIAARLSIATALTSVFALDYAKATAYYTKATARATIAAAAAAATAASGSINSPLSHSISAPPPRPRQALWLPES